MVPSAFVVAGRAAADAQRQGRPQGAAGARRRDAGARRRLRRAARRRWSEPIAAIWQEVLRRRPGRRPRQLLRPRRPLAAARPGARAAARGARARAARWSSCSSIPTVGALGRRLGRAPRARRRPPRSSAQPAPRPARAAARRAAEQPASGRHRHRRHGRPLPGRPRRRRASGATCATASSRSRFFTDEELAAAGRRRPSCCATRATCRRAASLDGRRAVRRRVLRLSARARPRSWTRSSGCSWSAPGRRWRTPATTPTRYAGPIGVFAGAEHEHLPAAQPAAPTRSSLARPAASRSLIGNDKDFLTTRVSYKLNLRGPSVTVQTACSTSLVAVHLACQSLLDRRVRHGAGRRRRASTCRRRTGYLYQEGGILSPDGHCRAFDARARRARSSATASASWC